MKTVIKMGFCALGFLFLMAGASAVDMADVVYVSTRNIILPLFIGAVLLSIGSMIGGRE